MTPIDTKARPRFLSPIARLSVACALALGCDRRAPEASAATAAPPNASSGAAAGPGGAAPPLAGGSPFPSPGDAPGEHTLFGNMAREAQSRKRLAPTVEESFAAFEKAGVKVLEQSQTLGRTYNALYCVGGYTQDRAMAVNVCEYPDAASAAAGRDLSKQILANVTSRDVWSHQSSTLSIVQLKRDPETAAGRKNIVDTFDKL